MIARIQKRLAEKTEGTEKGFTLVELLVVIIIIGILAAIAIPLYLNQQAKAKDSSLQSDLKNAQIEIATQLVDDPTGTSVDLASFPTSNDATITVNGDIATGFTVCGTVPGGAHAAGYCLNQDGEMTKQ